MSVAAASTRNNPNFNQNANSTQKASVNAIGAADGRYIGLGSEK